MRRRGHRFIAGLLAGLMILSSSLGQTTSVYAAEEIAQTVESRVETSDTDSSKVEESSVEESKTEESKTEESKTEESKTEESKTEESKTEESSVESSSVVSSQEEKPTESSESTTVSEVSTVCEAVTASVAPGTVAAGTKVALSTATEGAVVMYNTNGTENYTTYKGEIEIAADTTIYAVAVMEDKSLGDSEVATFTYTVKVEDEDTQNIVTIKQAREAATGTEEIVVKGTVTFIDGKNIYLQDETAGIDVFYSNAPSDIKIGDTLTVKGKRATYKGLEELSGSQTVSVESATEAVTLPATEVTIAQLLEDYKADGSYESTRVYIKDVTIGEIKTSDKTTLTDADGNVINIYKIPSLTDVKAGDTVSVYAVVGDFDGIQLRVASASDVEVTASKEEDETTSTLYDPVTDEMIASVEGAINVKEAATLTSGTATVVGQVVYAYVNKAGDNPIYVILEDVIDDEVYGYLIYDYTNYSKYNVGDIVAVQGTAAVYNNLPEIKNVSDIQIIGNADPIEAQEVTVSELGADYLSEYVCIKDATLGAYAASGNTSVTDATGSINIYNGAAYPDGVTEGSVADVYAACTIYRSTYQLKNSTSSDYKVNKTTSSYEIDESITLDVATFAGTAKFTGNTVYGDLYAENDFLDTDTKLTLSTGEQPLISTSTYSIGSKGLATDQYYQIDTSSAQYGNLEVSFMMKGSNTGAKNFVLEYSTDGENFYNAGNGTMKYTAYSTSSGANESNTMDIKNGAFSLQTKSKFHEITIALPEGANNAKNLTLRIRVADGNSIKGGSIGTGGTNYLNDIKITANPLVSDEFCHYVVVDPEAGEAAVGTQITLSSDTSDAKIYYAFNGGEYTEYNGDSKPVINELPCTLSTYASKDGIDDSIVITYEYTQAKTATVKASPNGGAVALGTKVKLSCETQGATIYYAIIEETASDEATTEDSEDVASDEATTADSEAATVADDTQDDYDWQIYESPISITKLPCDIAVKASKDGYEDSAVKTLSFTERENEKYNIYFGQLHAHTSYSDGAGTCEEAFAYASEVENLDFLAITDHSNSFDNADQASILDGSMSEEWVEGHELAEKYTTDDFVGLYGYEMTWSNGLGHMNTFNTEGFQSRTQEAYKTYSTALQNYYATLQTAPDSISMFNHPGTTFGDFSDFAYYSDENDALITTIEVGNGEGAIGSSGYFPSYEYYTRALDKGWHVAPTNNQDNHKGKWGSANTARSVVLADSLTQEGIYDAMRNYRVYATEDNDLNIYYTLDSYIMGSILDKDMVGDTVEINVELSDATDAKLGKVEVIVNGGLSIASKTVDVSAQTVTFEVPSSYSYYYIKVTEDDGDIAVTAPVWVGEVEAAGINDLSTDEALPISGEALDVTLDLYNNEENDLTINSIEFSVDGEVVNTVDLETENLTKVDPESEASYTFSYTHNEAGSMEMDVVVKATLNGVDKVYNDVLQLTYVDDSMVSHVVIDGTHYNDYVTGYYGGNMGSFISIAANKNIKAKIVTDEITSETLENASVLIVSAPGKKTGTANAGDFTVDHYEDSFLETVKEYVENGGTVIVCGLADYQDTTSGQTATETNKLLEAIGSTIRMNSDEAYDTVNNGGQPYRLYYENVNTDSDYLDGFVDGQTYSAYSGCTVDITNATQETDSVYPATWLVKGFDTTYSIDCKTDAGEKSDQSVYIEQGNVVALASQQTKFGGEIFVAGSVFMSDFEVDAEIDNNDSLPYANYTIINNILESKKVEIEATDIATVRQGELDEVFAIEGYVTNGTANENTTFFDTIYVQDETGGITVFPFSTSGLKNGTKIRVVGYVDEYQGDKELQLVSYEILDDVNLVEVEPTQMSVVDSMDYEENGGMLISVTGKVAKVESEGEKVSEFWIEDEAGNQAAIFIDGYILSGTTGENTLASTVKVGNTVTAVGLLYLHPEGDSDESVPVLRVRDCDEITLVEEGTTGGSSTQGSSQNTDSDSDNQESSSSSTTAQATYTITEHLIPLANTVTDNAIPYVDIAFAKEDRMLKAALLSKYYGRNLYLMTHLGNGIGFSIYGGDIKDLSTEYDLDSMLMQLPDTEGFKAFYMKPSHAMNLSWSIGVHMNLGAEYTGKKAYVYKRNLFTDSFVLASETTVNEIGNVALTTNELSDIIVLIAQ